MDKKSIRVLLLIEDNPGDARLMREMLHEQNLGKTQLTHVERLSEAEQHLAQNEVDIIVLDLGLPDAQGLSAVQRAHAAAPRVPLVVLTALDDEVLAARALQEGAQDYLIKDQIDGRGLVRALRYAVERKLMEEALFAEQERAQVTLNSIGDAVACADCEGAITYLNRVAEELTGWSLKEALGQPIDQILQVLDGSRRALHPDPTKTAIGEDEVVHLPINCVLIRRDGSEIPIEDSVAPIHDRDGLGIGAVIVFRDVSVTRQMALQISYSAEHDFLTSLPNRRLLNDRVGQAIAIAHRHSSNIAVLFLDLDGFKHINDSLGHSLGDKLLQSVAESLVECVRKSDTVSRQGGDEFVVLLSEVEGPDGAAVLASRLLKAVSKAHTIDQHELHITTSIGVSIYPNDGLDAETLIRNADTAMYQAKENGRQSVRFFKTAMNLRAVERQSIEEDLGHALEREEFALHYQPKIDLLTGQITGAEALLRWTHPVRGKVPPGQFIAIAEDCGLISPISRWVIREACRQTKGWLDEGLAIDSIAVNISATEFRNNDFLETVVEILESTGMDAQRLELELTESVLMKHAEHTHSVLKALRDIGIRVAVDDFGTGYSSLSYLRRFNIDSLKIDQSFVHQIATTPEDASIVSAIISMGKSLRLRLVAEGVETVDELDFLRAQGCDEAQGYLFSRPIPADEFTKLLKEDTSARALELLPT
jgi:diguanylate cyclase (GGDEF)-like protein/PAS domain S-box-containing protein